METKIMIQSTPNPNALKFVLNKAVKTEGNVTYKQKDECEDNPLAQSIFEQDEHVKEVYFFDNYITVTQDGQADWDDLEELVKKTILEKEGGHNPDFTYKKDEETVLKPAESTPEILQINGILDETIRPALQMDGGDLQILSFGDNVLKIYYQGACGSCPSATAGTLYAIQNILREQFHPELTVELAEV